MHAKGQAPEEGVGRPKVSETKVHPIRSLEKKEAPTLSILRSMEHEEGRSQKRDFLYLVRSNRLMPNPNITPRLPRDATVMRNRTGCFGHRE
ncbi:MAG: hypothetical protein CXT66_00190 [Methanobacteriota archaeon]|nr:MAG: hypothetical protein CXT66_00190 [Euryarchaeota archaeon]